MKILSVVMVLLFGGFLIYCSLDFPPWGDPLAPANLHVSPRYIENALEETLVPNIVTAVLADYRGYDTMFETIVIFCAGVACLFLLRLFSTPGLDTRFYRHIPSGITLRIRKGLGPPAHSMDFERIDTRFYRHIPSGITLRIRKGLGPPAHSMDFERIDPMWVPYDVIVKTGARLIVPFSQLFALYVIAHGHHSPGGGFQGGVILGASIILFAISNNLRSSIARISEKNAVLLCGLGVLMYAGTGTVCLLLGSNYLDYSALAHLLGIDPVTARSHGILMVEIGVGISVMAVMVVLYYSLASAGRYDEGL